MLCCWFSPARGISVVNNGWRRVHASWLLLPRVDCLIVFSVLPLLCFSAKTKLDQCSEQSRRCQSRYYVPRGARFRAGLSLQGKGYFFNHNTTNNDYIYSAVIMARPLQEFTRFMRWMQTKRQVAANPQTKPTYLGCESTCRLSSSTPTITIYYYYSSQRLILILSSHGG